MLREAASRSPFSLFTKLILDWKPFRIFIYSSIQVSNVLVLTVRCKLINCIFQIYWISHPTKKNCVRVYRSLVRAMYPAHRIFLRLLIIFHSGSSHKERNEDVGRCLAEQCTNTKTVAIKHFVLPATSSSNCLLLLVNLLLSFFFFFSPISHVSFLFFLVSHSISSYFLPSSYSFPFFRLNLLLILRTIFTVQCPDATTLFSGSESSRIQTARLLMFEIDIIN
jgi:hypothetical protein